MLTVDEMYLANTLKALTTAVNDATHFRQMAIELSNTLKEAKVGETSDEAPDEGQEVSLVRKTVLEGKE